MKRLFYTALFSLLISFSAVANEDNSVKVDECWKGFNKASFALNQTLDGFLFEPMAKGYRYLPSPIRKGTGNVVSNISNLMTINRILLQYSQILHVRSKKTNSK